MRTWIAVFLGTLALVPGPARAAWVWSVSADSLDFFDIEGSAFSGQKDLYLFLWCDDVGGATGARMDVTGALEIVSFTPRNGVVQNGTLPTLDLVFPQCIDVTFEGELLAGVLRVNDPSGAGGDICFSGVPVTTACTQPPGDLAHFWYGFSSTGEFPCLGGTSCAVDIVVSDTWGRVKAQFRD
jgi:hypothetical protein